MRHTKALIGLVATSLLVMASAGRAQESAGTIVNSNDWPQIHYGADHTNYNPAESILNPSNVPNLVLRWSASIPSNNISPVVANGILYGGLYAFNAVTGAPLWSNSMGGSTPAVANGAVYIYSGDWLSAFDANTGAQLWGEYEGSVVVPSPTVVNGTLYFGTWSGLIAIDGVTGATLWNVVIGQGEGCLGPSVANGVVYALCNGKRLYEFDAQTGAIKSSPSKAVDNDVSDSPAVSNGRIYIAGDFIYAFGTAGGAAPSSPPILFWKSGYLSGETYFSSTPAVANGVVYAGVVDYFAPFSFLAFNAANGKLLWNYYAGQGITSSPALANGVAYSASKDMLYALDAGTGALLWRYSLAIDTTSSPAVSNGMVYIITPDTNGYSGRVLAFGLPN